MSLDPSMKSIAGLPVERWSHDVRNCLWSLKVIAHQFNSAASSTEVQTLFNQTIQKLSDVTNEMDVAVQNFEQKEGN